MAEQRLDQATIDRVIALVAQLPKPAFLGLIESSLQTYRGDRARGAAADELAIDLQEINHRLTEGVSAIKQWWRRKEVSEADLEALGRGWPEGRATKN